MSKGIRLSEKYGVNPSMTVCYWCGEPTGIALMGHIGDKRKHEDKEAPKYCFGGYEPCDACEEKMRRGTTLMEASTEPIFDGQPEAQDGCYPTGRYLVMKKEVAEQVFNTSVGKAYVDKQIFAWLLEKSEEGNE